MNFYRMVLVVNWSGADAEPNTTLDVTISIKYQ